MSPDPLGCLGGKNLQAFNGSPTLHVDPLGLACLGIHKNLKDHYISKQKILEGVLGIKLPRWKDSNEGQLARQRLGEMIESGELRYMGLGTFKAGQDPVHMFEAPNGTIVTVWQNGQWNTALEPGQGMALNPQYNQPSLPGMPRAATPFQTPGSWGPSTQPASAPGPATPSNQLPLL
jgi:hypothetical protein